MRKPGQPIADLFAEAKGLADECWVPKSVALNAFGYGRVTMDGRSVLAHRVVYERLVGPIPVGLELDHLCANRPCVNPAHLEPVTHLENVRRARKDHCPRGHAYEAERPDGTRQWCRTCRRDRDREIRSRPPAPPRKVSGIAAIHAAKTTCKNGHPFDEIVAGARSCSTCRLTRARAAYRARVAA